MFQGQANRTIGSLAVLPVEDDLTGGATVGIYRGEGRKDLECGGGERCSLVLRPERGRRKGPGFHCLRMRLIICKRNTYL